MANPRIPSFFTPSSICSAASDGCCSATLPRPDETIRMRGAEFRDFLVLNLDDLAREIHIGPIPERIDRHGLHIDSHFVQIRETLFYVIVHVGRIFRLGLLHIAGAALARDAILDEFPGFGHANVGVDVNDLYALAANDDVAPFAFGGGLRAGLRQLQRKPKKNSRNSNARNKIPAAGRATYFLGNLYAAA